MKFCLVDVNNLVHRAKHVVSHYDSFDDCVGMTLTILFGSLRKSYEKFGSEHCVACFDSYSWRKDLYPDYKAGRDKGSTPKKEEEYKVIIRVLQDLREFLEGFTNVTVLETRGVEADDFIARWVQIHHDEGFEHIIISADSDFKQLVRSGVELYDPIRNFLYTTEGVFYQDGRKPRKDQLTSPRHGETWKVKMNKQGDPETFDPEWDLFYKCVRGKSSNYVKSAYPRVTEKKMRAAFEDRGGPIWNDFINAIWGPPENRQCVRERYEFNRKLLDLQAQPQEIRDQADNAIAKALEKDTAMMVGAYFMKFCSKHRLRRLIDQSASITQLLAAPY